MISQNSVERETLLKNRVSLEQNAEIKWRTLTLQMIAVLSRPAVASHSPSCENSNLQISSVCSVRI